MAKNSVKTKNSKTLNNSEEPSEDNLGVFVEDFQFFSSRRWKAKNEEEFWKLKFEKNKKKLINKGEN
jgi:hypothetical protein